MPRPPPTRQPHTVAFGIRQRPSNAPGRRAVVHDAGPRYESNAPAHGCDASAGIGVLGEGRTVEGGIEASGGGKRRPAEAHIGTLDRTCGSRRPPVQSDPHAAVEAEPGVDAARVGERHPFHDASHCGPHRCVPIDPTQGRQTSRRQVDIIVHEPNHIGGRTPKGHVAALAQAPWAVVNPDAVEGSGGRLRSIGLIDDDSLHIAAIQRAEDVDRLPGAIPRTNRHRDRRSINDSTVASDHL